MEKPKKTIVRVELAFADGEVQRLTGEDAERWLEAANAQAVFCHLHGQEFPSFQWETTQEKRP